MIQKEMYIRIVTVLNEMGEESVQPYDYNFQVK